MAKAPKLNTDSIYDFVIRNYGNLSFLRDFMLLNELDTLEEFDLAPIGSFLLISGVVQVSDDVEFPDYRGDASTDYTNRDKKQPNQNLFDYVLTHYGSLNDLGSFILDNELTTIGEVGGLYNYETSPIGTKFKVENSISSSFTSQLREDRAFVATNADATGFVFGDYSKLDYNIDFR